MDPPFSPPTPMWAPLKLDPLFKAHWQHPQVSAGVFEGEPQGLCQSLEPV